MSSDLETLIQQLASQDRAEQAAAAETLARMGSEAQPAAAALVNALRMADAPTREWCTAALEELGPATTTQIADFVNLARNTSLDAAYWAITLLGRAGDRAAPAVPTLINLLQCSPESALRERAAWALGKLGPTAATAVPALRIAAAGNDPRLARLAQQAIGAIEL
jgi:HEAT repeat protein